MSNIERFMQRQVDADTSFDFQKLYAPFWFIVYYVIGYPLRILGGLADGFVIYGLVYAARQSFYESLAVAILGAVIIQVMLGESTTITAKNLFRGLFYRSLAYGMMLLVTMLFTGGSLYSTLFLSQHGSIHAIESVTPSLQAASLDKEKAYNDQLIASKTTAQQQEIETIKKEYTNSKKELKSQIKAVEKLIAKKQRKVNSYAAGAVIPWEHREPIIKGQRQLTTLNTKLSNLIEQEKKDLTLARKRHGVALNLAEQSKIKDVNTTIAANKRKQAKLSLFGMLAMGANVGINLLSFLIILGYELYLKFAQGGGEIAPQKRYKNTTKEEEQTNEDLTKKSTEKPIEKPHHAQGSISKNKIERFVPQQVIENSTQKLAQKISENSTQKEATIIEMDSVSNTVFAYEKHVKNAVQNYKRAYQKSKTVQTTYNRMSKAQQHVNALLNQGFNVWIDPTDKTKLKVDKIHTPTLKKGHWECTVCLKNEKPFMEKFEVESALNLAVEKA